MKQDSNSYIKYIGVIFMSIVRYKGNSLLEFVEDYCIIDIETTGYIPYLDEIIELGAIRVREGAITDTFATLIHTDKILDEYIIELTGITNEMVAEAPYTNNILPEFIDFISDDIILAHNANFDINFIYDVSLKILEKQFDNNFIDTLRLSRRILTEHNTHRLEYLKTIYKLNDKRSHRAEDDCVSAYNLYNLLKCECENRQIDLNACSKNFKKYYPKISAKDIVVNDGVLIDEEHIFFDKVCVFTGTLEKMPRKEAMQSVVNLGGKCGDRITRETDYLIMGKQDYSKFANGNKSSKTIKAKKLIEDGQPIQIISEFEFYQYI